LPLYKGFKAKERRREEKRREEKERLRRLIYKRPSREWLPKIGVRRLKG
jgi:hypothetical protein